MSTVGQLLKEAREAKFYTLEEVEKATKIKHEFLTALEADNYSQLPSATFVKGFIKNYAKFLKLDQNKLLAIFRREFPKTKQKPYVMDAFSSPVSEGRLKITPGRVFGLVVLTLTLSFFAYLWFQFHQFVNPPNLFLSSPPDQLTTDSPSILVEGKTDPEIKVSVNSQEIEVGPSGDFKEEISLSSPVNKVSVVATSKFGQKTQIERMVYLKQ